MPIKFSNGVKKAGVVSCALWLAPMRLVRHWRSRCTPYLVIVRGDKIILNVADIGGFQLDCLRFRQ